MVFSSTSLAGSLDIPHSFSPGTEAKSSEVNSNFNAVEVSVDDNAVNIIENTNSIGSNADGIKSNTDSISFVETTVTDNGTRITSLESKSWEISGSNLHYNSGNVGVGTNDPQSTLDVNGVIRLTGGSYSTISNYTPPGREILQIRAKSDAVDSVTAIHDGSGMNLYGNSDSLFPGQVKLFTGGKTQITVTQQGNVGIGIISPLSKLAVNGLPASPPDVSGNAGVLCVTNEGNFWLDNDGIVDCN